MGFNDIETKRIEKEIKAFIDARRPPAEVRDRLSRPCMSLLKSSIKMNTDVSGVKVERSPRRCRVPSLRYGLRPTQRPLTGAAIK
jgi:hypothetical protein